jgi:two-component sensor histidine kinase/uncharacterized membrane protein YeaQ/YmgE (transglycosylase-associated protein family)
MDPRAYALCDPSALTSAFMSLPGEAAFTLGRGQSVGLTRYRNFPAFSWPWCWRRSILFGVFAGSYGVYQGITLGVMLNDWRSGIRTIAVSTPICLMIVCLGPLLAAWVRQRRWHAQRERVGVVLAVLLGVVGSHGGQWIANQYTRTLIPRMIEAKLVPADAKSHPRNTTLTALIYVSQTAIFFLLGGGMALRTYVGEQKRVAEETRERAVSELRLQKQEADLRLLVLQAQIEPHFLFNTLASLRSLLRQDVDRAETTIDALVEHLRAALPILRADQRTSTLSDQLRLCSSYLDLMTVRMRDRLTYAIEVPEALRSAAFPPLILLTLVENAVKHGIEAKPGPGEIRIAATRESRADGPHIVVRVIDDGMGLSTGLGHGVGLSNIRAQLALKYRDRATLSLTGSTQGGAVASIDIPEDEATAE